MMTPNDEFVDEPDEWAAMTPQERWAWSTKLWEFYLSMGVLLIPNPIHRVLSTLKSCSVRFLLSGGQACALYSATGLILAILDRRMSIAAACHAELANASFTPYLGVRAGARTTNKRCMICRQSSKVGGRCVPGFG